MDRVETLQLQKRNARALFGDTTITANGRALPGLDPAFARKLLDYWIEDATRVMFDRVGPFGVLGESSASTAIEAAYFRNIDTMRGLRAGLSGAFVGDTKIFQIWEACSQSAFAGFAIATSPSDWELIGESIKEAIDELPSTLMDLPLIGTALKVGIAVLALIALREITR